MAARARTTPGGAAGAGRVTLLRTGGAAGPDWGVYALLYATRHIGGRTEAVIGYCAPDADFLDPAWALYQQQPYGPAGTARRPLLDYAAAANPPCGRG
ncbi:hypothetical protein ACFY00_30690 [Kitasatospora sp. NPDC001540]|uniref:hypothetical protein n=1 Tax=Kitasatospora sp. NPDC001540 TaxID=3364014 RepID=UPI003696479D